MLRKLWNEAGLSASMIAERLGGCTRNAVLGMANRMKLASHARIRSSMPRKPRRADGALAKRVKAIRNGSTPNPSRCEKGRWASSKVPPTLPPSAPPPTHYLTFDQLRPSHCRWPAGEGKDIRFCGEPRWCNSESYCEHHEHLSRDPNQPRRVGGFSLNLKLGDRAA